MTTITPFRKIAFACAVLSSLASLQADTIFQKIDGYSQINWNNVTLWGNGTDPIIGTNDYQLVSGLNGTTTTDLVINGQTWAYSAQARTAANVDSDRNNDTTFSGGSLIITSGTRLISKTRNNATITADIVLNGGYIDHSPDYTSGTSSAATLAGTITFGSANVGAIFALANSTSQIAALNVMSSISGDATKTLQLSMSRGSNTGGASITLSGDMSNFFGTIYVGITGGNGVNASSFFSIQTDAINATLQLDAWTYSNFRYDLGSANYTFSSVILNSTDATPITLTAGETYDAAALNALIGGGTKFFGTGTITVVPEPGTMSLALFVLGLAILRLRRRLQFAR